MAKDTQLLVSLSGWFNEQLSTYRFHLQDKGVNLSKAELVIHLAEIGLKHELKGMEADIQDGDGY